MAAASHNPTAREFRVWLFSLCGLLGFALAQPLFDLLLGHPTFLLEHRVGWSQLIALIACAWLLGAFWALSLLLLRRISAAFAAWVFAVSAGLLVALTVLPALHLRLTTSWALVAALALVLFSTWAIHARPRLRTLLATTVLAGLVFPLLFLIRFAAEGDARPPATDLRASGRNSVFLIVMDEVPIVHLLRSMDELDSSRIPQLTRFAADAIWFRHAYTANAYSERSVPIFLTGRRPKADQRPTLRDHQPNIFTLLQDSYDVVATESLTDLCPQELGDRSTAEAADTGSFLADCAILWAHRVLPVGLAAGLPSIDHRWSDFLQRRSARREPTATFRAWLARIQASERPTLGFLHMLYPHGPYVRYADGRRFANRSVEPFLNRTRWIDDEWATRQARFRARLQLSHYDSLLGEFFAHLRALGLYDDAVIAIVADHGASFRPGLPFRVTVAENLRDILPIPMFVKLPGAERGGTVDHRLVSSLDLLPTLFEAAGIELAWRMDGRSMLDSTVAGRAVAEILQPAAADTTLRVSAEELRRYEDVLQELGIGSPNQHGHSLGPHAELVGQSTRDLPTGAPSDAELFLFDANSLLNVDRGSDWIPGELRGSLETAAIQTQSRDLAVALRDTIVAVTKTVREAEDRRAWEWVALLAPSALHDGSNHPEFFELEAGPRLRALAWLKGSPSYLDRRLGLGTTAHLALSGFYPDFPEQGEIRRWTNGRGRLVVPIRATQPAQRLRLELAASSPDGCRLQLLVAGRTLLDRRIEAGPWSEEIDIPAAFQSSRTEIEIRSSSFVPARRIPSSTDTRELGVLLRGLWLLSAEAAASSAH